MLEAYISTQNLAMNYKGIYISVDEDWFFGGKNKLIENKISEEYELIGKYAVFSPPFSFSENDAHIRYFKLYKRKQ